MPAALSCSALNFPVVETSCPWPLLGFAFSNSLLDPTDLGDCAEFDFTHPTIKGGLVRRVTRLLMSGTPPCCFGLLAGHPVKICHHASPSCGYPLRTSQGGFAMAHHSYRCRPPGTSRTRRIGVFHGFLASSGPSDRSLGCIPVYRSHSPTGHY